MAIKDQHITIARSVLTLITWARIGKVAVVVLISILLVFLWLGRGIIFQSEKENTVSSKINILQISNSTKNNIKEIVEKSDPIIAIQVVTINFQKNIRSETFAAIDNPLLQAIYDRVNNNKVVEVALFDESPVNNTRILRLINGEFVCVPYREATAYKYAPDGEKIVEEVCAIGIPPNYGNFSGILTIYSKKKFTKDELDQMFLLARSLSLKIYEDNRLANENRR